MSEVELAAYIEEQGFELKGLTLGPDADISTQEGRDEIASIILNTLKYVPDTKMDESQLEMDPEFVAEMRQRYEYLKGEYNE